MRHPGRVFRWWLAAGALFSLSSAFGCHVPSLRIQIGNGNKAKETFQKQFTAEKVRTLRVLADAGDITVTPTPEGEVIRIKATKIISGKLDRAKLKPYLEKLEVLAALKDGALVVESRFPNDASTQGISAYVTYSITVPKRMALDLHSASGSIKVRGIGGGIQVESASGDVDLKDVGGEPDSKLEVRTASGGIEVKNAKIADLLRLHSASGDVEVARLESLSSRLQADLSSQSGAITFSGDATELEAQTASGDIEATLTDKRPLVSSHLQSASGSVTLTLPRAASAKVETRTASGEVEPPTNIRAGGEARSLTFTLGEGGAPIRIETASGDITVRTR